jgi:hypothetical protein
MSEPTLVERLRFDKRHGASHVATCLEAADRIEEMEAEDSRLRGVLLTKTAAICELEAMHGPTLSAEAEKEVDPTPYCSWCGAMEVDQCHCGPICENH